MRKTERLDQILIRLGFATKAQVDEAVARQKVHGGRIGTSLVELGAITEEQLFDALVEQFRVPTIEVDESVMRQSLLERLPEGLLAESLVVPISWNESLGVLSVVVANPSDDHAIEQVRAVFGAKKVRVALAPEGVLADLIMQLGGGDDANAGVRLVALPELFETVEEAEPEPTGPAGHDARTVLMVTEGAVRRDFLPAVFKAEQWALSVANNASQAHAALSAGVDALLVSSGMSETFADWVNRGAVPPPTVEVTMFSSVSGALLENPAPYETVAASARASVHALAEYRSIAEGVAPPYALMATEIEALARRLGLSRLAIDGLDVGLHLLIPVEKGRRIEPFTSFAETIELAHRVRFPWPVDRLLSNTLGLFLGRVDLPAVANPREEVLRAAQVLALVWFRHNLTNPQASEPEDATNELRASLRELAGRLATLDVIEEYLDLISDRGSAPDEGPRRILLVGAERLSRALRPALTRVGSTVDIAPDAQRAQAAATAGGVDAIIVDHATFGADVEKLCRMLRVDRSSLIFVVTDDSDPALVLNLLDIGVDDVFAPPHDFDIMSARVHRSLRSRASAPPRPTPDGQFSATLDAFSFFDLAQVLANGLKSVRVSLRRGSGEGAVMYFEKGRPVHAACGTLVGPEAVYHVITWESDGAFVVDEVADFPQPNLAESVESLLMEGVRLLDESRA